MWSVYGTISVTRCSIYDTMRETRWSKWHHVWERMITLWHKEWNKAIKLWQHEWHQTSFLLHHQSPFIENICAIKCIIWYSMSETNCSIYGTLSEAKSWRYDKMSDTCRGSIYWHHIRRHELLTKLWVWLECACTLSEIRRWLHGTMNNTICSVYDKINETSWSANETMSHARYCFYCTLIDTIFLLYWNHEWDQMNYLRHHV